MAGIDFDRQVFIPASEPIKKPSPQFIGVLVLLLASAGVALVAFKLYSDYSKSRAVVQEASEVEQLKAQLADMQRRLDQYEKHHKPAAQPVVEKPAPAPAGKPKREPTRYQIRAASVLSPRPNPEPEPRTAAPNAASAQTNAMLAANHEAWQATTERLADVVGIVGTQQGQISETRDQLNALLAQTKRKAVSFELRKGSEAQPVGPVSLQLKDIASKSQRYTVCVYRTDQCVELKDRALGEVVVFVVTPNTPPFELVITKLLREQAVGYLEIPVDYTGSSPVETK